MSDLRISELFGDKDFAVVTDFNMEPMSYQKDENDKIEPAVAIRLAFFCYHHEKLETTQPLIMSGNTLRDFAIRLADFGGAMLEHAEAQK